MNTLPLLDDSALPIGDAGFGALETERGRLPLVALDVRARICDLHAETLVRQTFRNSLDVPIEATYIFPLPDRAAATRFTLRVAGRVIEGDLKERGQARQEYDQAIQAGHRAAIAEEERSGVFTLRVGNLPPHEDAVVEFTLVGPLPVSDGEATFRFPLVVAPRYTPGIPLDGPPVGSGTTPDTDQVPDASRVTPPVLLPGFPNPVRLSLEVEFDRADIPSGAASIRSSLHSVVVGESAALTIRLQPGERLNRDFILRFPVAHVERNSFRSKDQGEINSVLHTSLKASAAADKPGVYALTLYPPATLPDAPARPREIVFLLDRSGSMEGWKMVAARRALGRMIDSLLDHDRFTVVAFDSAIEHPPHAAGFVAGNNRERWRMLEWLGKIGARGGTELGVAAEQALALFAGVPPLGGNVCSGIRPAEAGTPTTTAERILVLVTDGQVSGEDVVLRKLRSATPGELPRIFTVGIDRAVNAGFLKRLADLGRGDCELVESEDRLDEAMDRIHRLIGTPVLTQVMLEPIDADVIAAEQTPARLPDLFVDRPLTILGRHLSASGKLRFRIHGVDAQGQAWSSEAAAQPGAASLLTSMWGRARVRDLEDAYATGGRDNESLMKQIVAVSLESHVLSRFTAYVAVDRSEVVNASGQQHEITQPLEMPEGWEQPAVMRGCFTGDLTALEFSADISDYANGADVCDWADSIMREFTDTAIDFSAIDFNETEISISIDSGIAKMVDLMLKEAVQLGATEIHINPLVEHVVVTYLINGQSQPRDNPPRRLLGAILGRIRLLANMKRSELVGQFVWMDDNVAWTVNVSFTATPHGEAVVLTLQTNPPNPAAAPDQRKEKFWA